MRGIKGIASDARTASSMRQSFSGLLALMLASAALCAADVGHGAVAFLSRHSLIRGPYLTYHHDTIVPTMLSALALAAIAAVKIFGDALANKTNVSDDWLVSSAARITRFHFLALVPLIFVVQIGVLFDMETLEQTMVLGHGLGFAASMGMPLPLTLVVQAIAALAVGAAAYLVSRAVLIGAQSVARALHTSFCRLLATQPSGLASSYHHDHPRTEQGRLSPIARHIANRPPPFALSTLR